MPAHIFPAEVIDLVIDDLGGQLDISDPNFHSSPPYQTLLSTSLISRTHVETSQKQIFSCLKITRLPCSPAGLGKVQSIVARLDADPSLRQFVRDLWLQASSTYSTLFHHADEEDRTARETHRCLAQLFQLLSASLVNLTLHGPFNHIEFHRSLIQSIYHAKFSHLRRLALHCLGTIPMTLIEHLPPSLKVVSLRGLGHIDEADSIGKQGQAKPQLHSLTSISGLPGNTAVNVFHKKGLIDSLVELKFQVFSQEVSTYLQAFQSCRQTLQKVYLQFGTGPMNCTYAMEGLTELNHHLEADRSITLPHVKSTTVEVQLHAEGDRIVDPDIHPVFLNTLIGRQPSLEELTILYWIYIPDNQGVPTQACTNTQKWSNLDDLLSNEQSVPHLRSLDVDVSFVTSDSLRREAGYVDGETFRAASWEEEEVRSARHLKHVVGENLPKTTQRLRQAVIQA